MRKIVVLFIIIASCIVVTSFCIFPLASYGLEVAYREGDPITTFNAIRQIDSQGFGIISTNPEKYIISKHDFKQGLMSIGKHKNVE